MKKVKIIFGLLLTLFLLPMQTLKAAEDTTILSDDYYIQDYDVQIEVGEDNVFHITETLTYNFVQEHHGMTREIPLTHHRVRNDGSTSTVYAKVRNVECSDPIAEKGRDSGSYTIKVGEEDVYVSGLKTYTLSYDYDLGKDPLKGADELYFNIVGTEWKCPINHISWTIQMPKDFDADSLGYSVGQKGEIGYDDTAITSQVSGNTITGAYQYSLDAGEGLTIRCQLPEGYFSYEPNYIPYIIIYALAILASIIFLKTGKDDKAISVVSFEAPEGYTPADVAYVMRDGMVSNEDFTAMMIHLADQGYLKISELEPGRLSAKYEFTKLKDYDGDDPVAKTYLNGLFAKKNVVTTKDLKDQFYKTIDKCMSQESDKMKEKNLFYNTILPRIFYVICILVSLFMFGMITDSFEAFIFFFAAWGSGYFAIRPFALGKEHKVAPVLITLIVAVIFSLIANVFAPGNLLPFIVCGPAITMLVSYFALGAKKTPEGNRIYGQILGFQNFIEKAELDRLKMFVEEDPAYYYHILPYAYVLGLSDAWIDNFERLHMPPAAPVWYYGTHPFDCRAFNDSFANSMSTASSSPSSSGGGGSAGGGSGGGGGGAW